MANRIKLKDLLPEVEEKKVDNSNMYLDAGKDAPDVIKSAIEQFRNLSPEERAKQPLLWWLLGEGTPNYKMSKEDSQYVDKSTVDGQFCKNCKFLYKRIDGGKYICSQINENDEPSKGEVKLAGWCRLWKPMENTGD